MLSFAWQAGARASGGPWHPAAWSGEGDGGPGGSGGLIRAMTAAELQSEDPDRLARRWSDVIERPVRMENGHRVIALDDATLRFTEATDGRGEGLAGLDLVCADPGRRGLVLISGIRFRLLA